MNRGPLYQQSHNHCPFLFNSSFLSLSLSLSHSLHISFFLHQNILLTFTFPEELCQNTTWAISRRYRACRREASVLLAASTDTGATSQVRLSRPENKNKIAHLNNVKAFSWDIFSSVQPCFRKYHSLAGFHLDLFSLSQQENMLLSECSTK